jgi:hypothetical protein
VIVADAASAVCEVDHRAGKKSFSNGLDPEIRELRTLLGAHHYLGESPHVDQRSVGATVGRRRWRAAPTIANFGRRAWARRRQANRIDVAVDALRVDESGLQAGISARCLLRVKRTRH